MPQQTTGPSNSVAEAIRDTRRLVEDMNQRIARQQKRIEKMLVNREGAADEMQALLADMIEARDLMLDQLDSLKKEEETNGQARPNPPQQSPEA